jgi:energy-coupling factor transporter ATP-binding protein EcfA2
MVIEQINTDVFKSESNQARVLSHSDIDNVLIKFLENKDAFSYKTNIEVFDEVFCFKMNEFYLMTGRKGAGKTTISQIIQLIGSYYCGLRWVVLYKENVEWATKFNLIQLLLGDNLWKVYRNDKMRYANAVEFINKHFIFIKADNVRAVLEHTKRMIDVGEKIYGVVIDPINSVESGYEGKGNGYADGIYLASKILDFSKEVCSVFLSQHPTMSGQRSQEDVSSFSGEGGWFLNKASFIYSTNRAQGSNTNYISIESVRNKLTGGNTTNGDRIELIWSPTTITVSREKDIMPIELFK